MRGAPPSGSGGLSARLAGIRQRLPFYALGFAVAVLVLAWIDGGEEPLHPIAQSVDLRANAAGGR